ncbi:hypothetical protein G7Y89_g7609 [Cudoniella acicularis]|uniref:Uncharacterized protein n=1 Tax=Cudoniella acicularis TaxID=354080 RepID=A0A8H4W1S9_9HELO|nr:hypothetical protein G7Y89_g7609 [Cudoniella acicularis]
MTLEEDWTQRIGRAETDDNTDSINQRSFQHAVPFQQPGNGEISPFGVSRDALQLGPHPKAVWRNAVASLDLPGYSTKAAAAAAAAAAASHRSIRASPHRSVSILSLEAQKQSQSQSQSQDLEPL